MSFLESCDYPIDEDGEYSTLINIYDEDLSSLGWESWNTYRGVEVVRANESIIFSSPASYDLWASDICQRIQEAYDSHWTGTHDGPAMPFWDELSNDERWEAVKNV